MHEIRSANHDAGFFFFSPRTMRFFNRRVCRRVLGGGFFVTSERFDYGTPRRYSVRLCKESGAVETIGEFQAYDTSAQAYAAIQKLLRDTSAADLDALRGN